jgi:hypothetical protein
MAEFAQGEWDIAHDITNPAHFTAGDRRIFSGHH